ncbi:ankyrin [Decorospora gaudefroyi]|uniref:Ankyrin n=1 Tax=Decorospora gaudefroyi TaxID=184978 RepID=A0A6A5KUZ0_9PLEO|nr:ankyrin [Decorospora gaudefroyi]
MRCPQCYPEDLKSMLDAFKNSENVCGEFLALDEYTLWHREAFCDECEDLEHWFETESGKEMLIRSEMLGYKLRLRAHEIFTSLGLTEAARYAMVLGPYFPSTEPDYFFERMDCIDCLGRNYMNRFLDSELIEYCSDLDDRLECLTRAEIQKEDILGRAALHIACQRNLEYGVEKLLEMGVDRGTKTVYGHTPLHFAAANGSKDICQKLLAYKNRLDIRAGDRNKKTALDYAMMKNHTPVVDLLFPIYLEDGLVD